MVELTVVVDIQCCVSHTDIAEGEARLVVGWLAGVTDSGVDCPILFLVP